MKHVDAFAQHLVRRWGSLPTLPDDEVQIFVLRADDDPGLYADAWPLLSPAEKDRAHRIRVDRAREEFVIGRAALRVLLAAAIDTRPEALPLAVDNFGKPFLAGVHSNVSHSRGLVYLGLCRSATVGVDVEWIDPALEALELAEANFTPEETAHVAAAPAGWERARAFCSLWTRKEAVAKANGQGLLIPLKDIQVSGSDGVAFVAAEDGLASSPHRPERFFVQALPSPEGYLAALAVRNATFSLKIQGI